MSSKIKNQEILLNRQYLEEKLDDGMNISQHSKIRLVVDKILQLFNKNPGEVSSIKLYARGRCITKCIKVAEVMKQLLPNIQQITELGSTKVNLQYGIKDENGNIITNSIRNTDGFSSTICIILSNNIKEQQQQQEDSTATTTKVQIMKEDDINLKNKKSKKKSIFDF